jgi:predicted nuclease of predicted toxin-antitoxin system
VRFLIDEMFGADVAERLRVAGHDAVHVSEVDLAATDDSLILRFAASEARVLVTENAVDYLPLIDALVGEGVPVSPVVIVLKRHLPRSAGALSHRLATKLVAWAEANPAPYSHAHWLD